MTPLQALDAAARAFARAQKAGDVWISDDGFFQTVESQLEWVAPAPIHPDQLRLA